MTSTYHSYKAIDSAKKNKENYTITLYMLSSTTKGSVSSLMGKQGAEKLF